MTQVKCTPLSRRREQARMSVSTPFLASSRPAVKITPLGWQVQKRKSLSGTPWWMRATLLAGMPLSATALAARSEQAVTPLAVRRRRLMAWGETVKTSWAWTEHVQGKPSVRATIEARSAVMPAKWAWTNWLPFSATFFARSAACGRRFRMRQAVPGARKNSSAIRTQAALKKRMRKPFGQLSSACFSGASPPFSNWVTTGQSRQRS